jgi:hypothetical protein
MSDPQPQSTSTQPNGRFQWGLVILILAVLILASFAFGRPNGEKAATASPTATLKIFSESGTAMVGNKTTETVTVDIPPTPDEVGYTDGIIFFATILVLILLVGTLREVIHRKGV